MKRNWMMLVLLALAMAAMLAFVACSSDSGDDPTGPNDPDDPVDPGDGVFAGVTFHDFGEDARRVLPPVYAQSKVGADSTMWNEGDFALLGKVFSEHEPMSIHSNIALHDEIMMEIDDVLTEIAAYEAEDGEVPTEPIPFDNEYGTGTLTFNFAEPTAPIAVPAVCQTVFGCETVAVDYVVQYTVEMQGGETFESPYFGFTTGGDSETVYYWAVGYGEDGEPEGSQLFYAVKDTVTGDFDIAGAYFKNDGPGDEERCNWVYHVTGNDAMQFTYNMGWYAENPDFEMFACVQGSGNKDVEFGLRYHEYKDDTGWDSFEEDMVLEDIFGPIDDDPYAFIPEGERAGTIDDYVDETVMYHRDDSPLADIPNPFLDVFGD